MLAPAGGIDVTLRPHCSSANRRVPSQSMSFADERSDLQQEFEQPVHIPADANPTLVLRFAVGDSASDKTSQFRPRMRAVAPAPATVRGCPARWTIWSLRRPPS